MVCDACGATVPAEKFCDQCGVWSGPKRIDSEEPLGPLAFVILAVYLLFALATCASQPGIFGA